MLKIRLNCPVCGIPILTKSLEGHLEHVHELTGVVTLRLHPVSPYNHEPEPEPEPKGGSCKEKPEHEPEHKAEAEPKEPEPKTEPEVEPEPKSLEDLEDAPEA